VSFLDSVTNAQSREQPSQPENRKKLTPNRKSWLHDLRSNPTYIFLLCFFLLITKKGSYTRARSIRSFIYFGLLFLRFLVKQPLSEGNPNRRIKERCVSLRFFRAIAEPPNSPYKANLFSQNFRWVLVLFPLFTRGSAEN
jgi:hypothetical protein